MYYFVMIRTIKGSEHRRRRRRVNEDVGGKRKREHKTKGIIMPAQLGRNPYTFLSLSFIWDGRRFCLPAGPDESLPLFDRPFPFTPRVPHVARPSFFTLFLCTFL